MKKRLTPALVLAMIALLVALGGTAGAASSGLITGAQIKDRSIGLVDLSGDARHALKGAKGDTGAKGVTGDTGVKGDTGAKGDSGATGANGPKGDKGDSGLTGAFYATAFYNAGDTNAGAIATVACDADPAKTNYVAISGGVQVLGLDAGANSRNTPVSSSFPGRMDWTTNAPKPGRLDGWIVQFGGNAGATSDKDPAKVKVWALCVPAASIPVNQTFRAGQLIHD